MTPKVLIPIITAEGIETVQVTLDGKPEHIDRIMETLEMGQNYRWELAFRSLGKSLGKAGTYDDPKAMEDFKRKYAIVRRGVQ